MKSLVFLALGTIAVALPTTPKPAHIAVDFKRDAEANAVPTSDKNWQAGPRGEVWNKRDADAVPSPDENWQAGPRGEVWNKREADADAGANAVPTPDENWQAGPRGEVWN